MSWSDTYDGRSTFDSVVEALRAAGLEVTVVDSNLTYCVDDYGYDRRPFRRGIYIRPDDQMMIVEEWIAKERYYSSGVTRCFDTVSYLFGQRPELVTKEERVLEI